MRKMAWLVAAALGVIIGSVSAHGVGGCPGDCNGDSSITVDEIIQGVNIALGNASVSQCSSFDTSADGAVTIDELIASITAALNGCTRESLVGDYAAQVSFDATHAGILNLNASSGGQIHGSLLVTNSAARAARGTASFGFTFPVGGVSVALTGFYDPVGGGFEVEGSFVDANGQTVPVVISGDLPGGSGSATVNVYVGNEPPFTATLTAGMLATPTVAPQPTPTPAPSGGQRIVFAGGILEPHIFVINTDGTGKQQLTTSSGTDTSPAWSPDGSKIAFATPDAGNVHVSIAIINADGSGFRRLAGASATLDGQPSWSPDGSQLVFTAGGGDAIEAMNADGSNRRRLLSKLAGEQYRNPRWSPNGTTIAFTSTRGKATNHAVDHELFLMNADGTNVRQLTNNSFEDHRPDWYPDGSKLAFGRGGAVAGVYTIKPDGTSETKLVSDPFFNGVPSPSISADGQQILYQTLLGLKVANANGAAVATVTGTSFIGDFDFK